MDFSYRDTAVYRRLMRRPATWREDIRRGFCGLKHVSDGLHDISAVRKEYLYEIRHRIYLLFYVDCKPLLSSGDFRQLVKRYCRLTEEEYDLLRDEYTQTYKPPMRRCEAGPRSLSNLACHFIHQKCEYDYDVMRQLPLPPKDMDLLLWKAQDG